MSDRFAYDLEDVDSVMVGTVGPPGRRSFLLQAVRDGRALTVSLEKEQAAAMAAGLARLLNLLRREDPDHATDLQPAGGSRDLLQPYEEAFRVGSIGLGVDDKRHRVLLVLHELGLDDDDEADVDLDLPPGVKARLALRYEQALDLVQHIPTVVAGGRPNCPACGEPLDEGHRCQRRNGHH
ncbi:MAG: DUF3090 family protein [Anaerolineae bacterium]|jgi:uncharacterized repeat protein (TIGR03847 family)|nr:DUF3090 family protein [Ardenticatenia bacterium]MBK8541689.1 DUF3090 family protein [Ardenticatenia bacterium]HQZ70084.1 DUF3090 family protein [Anaerolineae bacterium]HRA19768.1 DUF3090 family protein [Anaerolineae bacterium]